MEEKEKKKTNSGTKKNQTKQNVTSKSKKKNNNKKRTVEKSQTTIPKKEPAPKVEPKVIEKEEKTLIEEPKIEQPKEVIKTPKKEFEVDYLTIIVLILACLCVFMVCAKLLGKDKKDYNESYLVKNKIGNKISCSDIPNALQGEKSYIFITNVGTEEEYMLEKRMATIIQDKNLKDDFYVYFYEDTCHPSTMKLDEKLEQVPAILYYRDGNLTEKIIREDKTMLQDGDFARIVDIYEE